MKKITKIGLVLMLGLVWSFTACNKGTKILVAEVNDGGVKLTDFQRTFKNVIKGHDKKSINPAILEQLANRVLNEQIVREVLLQTAKKNNISATDAEIDVAIENLQKQFKDKDGNDLSTRKGKKAYKKAITEKGFSEEEYRKFVSDNIVIEKTQRALIASTLKPVSEEEVKQFYANVASIYNHKEPDLSVLRKTPSLYNEANVVAQELENKIAPKVHVETLLVPLTSLASKDLRVAAKKMAQNLKEQLVAGKSLQTIVDSASENKNFKIASGNLVFHKHMTPKKLVEKALSLKIGEVSDPIEVLDEGKPDAQGIFVLKAIKKEEGIPFTYETFQKELTDYINVKRSQNNLAQATAFLVKQSKIRITDAFSPTVTKIIEKNK